MSGDHSIIITSVAASVTDSLPLHVERLLPLRFALMPDRCPQAAPDVAASFDIHARQPEQQRRGHAELGFVQALHVYLYGNPVHRGAVMDTISVNKFRDNLKSVVEQVVSRHEPLKVTRRAGEAFVVMSADDWEQEQETLYVLQNQSLMQQIAHSLETHNRSKGYIPTEEQMNEIAGI